MKKALAGVILLSGLALSGCADKTVASSTAGKISQDALYNKMKDTVGNQVLQQMLLEDVLQKQAGDSVTDKSVEAAFDEEVERFGGKEALEYALMSQGMTIDQYRENIRLNLLVEEAVKKDADFSEEEIKEAYDEYQPTVTAAHILVTDEDLAKELTEKINNGENFEELAMEYSEDEGTAPQGGEVTFSTGEMVEEVEEAAFALKEGEMTKEPVQSSYGYHIIKMIDKPEKGSLEEERDTIETLLIEQKLSDGEYVQSVLSNVVKDANIQINDDDLKNAMEAYMPVPETDQTEDSSVLEEESETTDSTSETETTDTTDTTEDSE